MKLCEKQISGVWKIEWCDRNGQKNNVRDGDTSYIIFIQQGGWIILVLLLSGGLLGTLDVIGI